MTFAFLYIGKRVAKTSEEVQCQKTENQCTSQVFGRMARRPNAPALAQSAASSLILLTKALVDGVAALNTQSLRCFHIIQGISNAAEASPLRIGFAV